METCPECGGSGCVPVEDIEGNELGYYEPCPCCGGTGGIETDKDEPETRWA